MAADLQLDKISPDGYWTVAPKQSRPLIKLQLKQGKVKNQSMSRTQLLDKGLIELIYDDCMCPNTKTIHIPVYIWSRNATYFFAEDLIDLGIVTQRDISVQYQLNLFNSYFKPAVIHRISIEKSCPGWEVLVSTFMRYKFPLPAGQVPFKALILIASIKEPMLVSYCKGKIVFEVDVKGGTDLHTITLPFRVGFAENLLGPKKGLSFIVS